MLVYLCFRSWKIYISLFGLLLADRVGQLYSWILLKQRKPQAEKCFFECLIAMANVVVKDILASLITYSDIKMDLVDKELAHIFRGFFYPFEAPAFIPKPLNEKGTSRQN